MDTQNISSEHPLSDKEEKCPTTFNPIDRTETKPDISLPDELWITILESPCTFPPDIFSGVMLNLIKNPNITSTHLFRADIFYDSEKDQTFAYSRGGMRESSLASHLKAEYRPREYRLPGYDLTRTIVRQLIPRNPQLDRALAQTCHFFNKLDEDGGEVNVVLYTPHVSNAEEIPFYHPDVAHLAFTHKWHPSDPSVSEATTTKPGTGRISLSYSPFPHNPLPTPKQHRTALRLLQTLHKHGQGQLTGYSKRMHHDQIIPQKRYQDTYARLKAKYGRHMSEQWVEVTDPGKHVFEDIGIAAFLVEIWGEMYRLPDGEGRGVEVNGDDGEREEKPAFPGFVDIGCGNGVLVYILLMEGYEGYGFDARERKTWRIFPAYIQQKLHRQILVPEIFQSKSSGKADPARKNGIFNPGTFIISNHADELTAWTPLLAYMNQSSFIAIPCCSHDLAGSRFRAPPTRKRLKDSPIRLPQQGDHEATNGEMKKNPQAAETGSLKKTEAQKKVPSAYSSLCSYIGSLAEEVAYKPEKDVLRIPSTRNHCIVGRYDRNAVELNREDDITVRQQKVSEIVERELRTTIEAAGADWIQRAQKLSQKPGSGH